MNHEPQQPPPAPANDELDVAQIASQTRRHFLKALSGITALAVTAPLAARTNPFTSDESPGGKWSLHKWGMAIDVDKCIGCGTCVRACKEENGIPNEPIYFRTWVERYRQFDENTIVDAPNGGYDGFPVDENGHQPDRAFFVPKLCNACEKSPCEQVCPVGATFRTPDGAVLVDASYCIGCRYCIQACPYGCRFLNPVTKTADKCTFCYHRIQKGLRPACVENCPTGARIFGDLKNPTDPLRVFLKENKTFVLKSHLNTYPKVRYHGIDQEVR